MSSSVSSASVAARVPEPGSRSSQVWRASQGSRPAASAPAGPASVARGRGGQAGGGHHDQLVRPDGEHADVPARLGPAAEHQVHLMPVEQGPHPVPVPGLQPDPQPRIPGPEAAQQPGHDLLGRGGHGRDAQLAALRVGGGRGRPPGLVEQAQDAADVARVRLARRRSAAARARPASTSATPSDFCSAASEAETAAWVTTSSCAAARTEPVSATARKVRSWFSVMAPAGC